MRDSHHLRHIVSQQVKKGKSVPSEFRGCFDIPLLLEYQDRGVNFPEIAGGIKEHPMLSCNPPIPQVAVVLLEGDRSGSNIRNILRRQTMVFTGWPYAKRRQGTYRKRIAAGGGVGVRRSS